MANTGRVPVARRFVHAFDSGADNPGVLGGKGASLARMHALGLPTPPGFTIATDGWRAFRADGERMPAGVAAELLEAMDRLETTVGRPLGDPDDPLLVSVRSGAPVSMPGMMDTVLNLGLGDDAVLGVASAVGHAFAWDVYRRLLATFAGVVRGIPAEAISAAGGDAIEDPQEAAMALQRLIADRSASPFPQRPEDQLLEAVEAVWRSWGSRRARRYRRHAGIPDDLGTAVTVQAMVFGNYDDRSGTGVVFTRDPTTGSPRPYGDYLARAQGEDVVAGGHDTEPLDNLRIAVPEAYAALEEALPKLEADFRDMCDVEFTVECGRLWILQARAGQRSGAAAIRIAVDLVDEGLIDVDEALGRISIAAIDQLQAPVFARDQALDTLGEGTPAAPGAAAGLAVFGADRAQELADAGETVILVRPETSPEDIAGMIAAAGVVTAVGGRTSHAAVVARGIGRPAVCGVQGLQVDPAARRATFGDRSVLEGEQIAMDGTSGLVVAGAVRLVPAQPDPRAARLLAWCDERRRVPIASACPDHYVTVTGPEDAGAKAVLVDIEWGGGESSALLDRTVRAVVDAGASEVAVRVPDALSEGDMRPGPAPWTMVVAESQSWPARLLAARLTVVAPA